VRGAPTDGLAPLGNQRLALIGGRCRYAASSIRFASTSSLLNHIRPPPRQAPDTACFSRRARCIAANKGTPHVRAACLGCRSAPDANPPRYARSGRARIVGTSGGSRRKFEQD
jgi:hypothetical protein